MQVDLEIDLEEPERCHDRSLPSPGDLAFISGVKLIRNGAQEGMQPKTLGALLLVSTTSNISSAAPVG
jgi:hypothetical protein